MYSSDYDTGPSYGRLTPAPPAPYPSQSLRAPRTVLSPLPAQSSRGPRPRFTQVQGNYSDYNPTTPSNYGDYNNYSDYDPTTPTPIQKAPSYRLGDFSKTQMGDDSATGIPWAKYGLYTLLALVVAAIIAGIVTLIVYDVRTLKNGPWNATWKLRDSPTGQVIADITFGDLSNVLHTVKVKTDKPFEGTVFGGLENERTYTAKKKLFKLTLVPMGFKWNIAFKKEGDNWKLTTATGTNYLTRN